MEGQDEKIILVIEFSAQGIKIGGNKDLPTEKAVELLEYTLKIIRDGLGERVKFGEVPVQEPILKAPVAH